MGSSQSLQQQDHMSFLAISPSPLVSIVKRPHHRLSDSVKSASSNRSNRSAQDFEHCTTNSGIVRKVTADEVNTNAVNTSEVKVCRDCLTSLHENSQSLKQHTKANISTYKIVNISEADTNEVSANSGNSNEVNTSRNYIDLLNNHHCNTGLLQHKCAVIDCIDNFRHHDVNTKELNGDELKTKEIKTNNYYAILHGQQNIIIQDTDRTSYAVKSNGANTNTSCSPSLHQQNCDSTKGGMSHSPTDSCNTLVETSAAYVSPSDVSGETLVQYCLKRDREEEFVTGGAICHLSMTELSLEEMTEVDQDFGRDYLGSLSKENQLVERGGSFEEQNPNGGDKKAARGMNLCSQNGARQIKKDDSTHGYENRLLRVTTDTVALQDRINTGQLKWGSKLSSTGTSNHTLDPKHIRCSDRSVNITSSNTATSDHHGLDRPHLGCSATFPSEASLIATLNAHDVNSQLQTYSISLRSNSACETGLLTAPVYVHPRTGEFHSMVFGSFSGDETHLSDCSRTFSQTQCAPESTGYSISHNDVSYGTGSFIYSLQEMTDCPSCDFKPDDRLSVHVGRAGPFDSFRDSVHSCSLEHNHDRCKVRADQSVKEFAQSFEAERKIKQKQQISLNELQDSCEPPQACFIPRKPTSSCEACNISNSCMVPVFGCSGDPLCHMCSINHQSLAKDTNSFSGIASSECKSQHSCDSWRDSLQMAGIAQATNSCFVDYDSDSCEFSTGHEQQKPQKNNCKCETKVDNRSTSYMVLNTEHEIETCEAATENFGFNRKCQISPPTFGDKCLSVGNKIFETQLLAENEIRGMDTGEFNDNCTVCSTSYLTTRQNKPMSNSFSDSSKHKHVTPAGMGCNSVSQQFLKKTDQVKSEGRSPTKSPPKSTKFNSSTFTSSDTRNQCREPLCLDENDQHDNTNWPYGNVDNSGSDLDDSSKENTQHSNDRSEGQHSRRENLGPQRNRIQELEMSGAHRRCLLQMQHSRSLSCDCSDPFKQNYVAYLCCAPEDLSSFGLTFHSMLEKWGFRIFIAPRDLELTGPKYENMARWLEERCNGKIIVILSKNYEKSDECLFLTYFARTLDPDSKNRNIIPVVIDKDVEIPNVLKGLSIIKYNYDFRCGWLKKKLVNAIAA